MAEEESNIPKPTIKDTPPPIPPVTTVDEGSKEEKAPKPTETQEEETTVPKSGGVETDLMKRFLGAFIDAIVAAGVGHIVGLITGSSILSLLVTSVAWLVRDSLPFLEGQSLGKKIMKTKAVKADGSSLSGDWTTGAIRNILMAVPFGGLVESVVILVRSGKPEAGMRLGDEWAKTKVISVD